MVAQAKAEGLTISIESGYRSYDVQVKAYNSILKGYGQAAADNESARAGYSEHQTGLAVDFGSESCIIQDCFANTFAAKWLAQNSYKYGFILRYPAGKSAITGYKFEPWHYRYVRYRLASELKRTKVVTLEEFFGISGSVRYK